VKKMYQKQPNRWSCFPTAVAIVLGINVQEIFTYLGHDGSERCWKYLNEPFCRRSFHQQEMVNFCFIRGYAMITICEHLAIAPQGSQDHYIFNNPEYSRYVKYHNGVLTGRTSRNIPHAAALLGGHVIDPTTGKIMEENLIIDQFHIIHKLDMS